MNVVETIVATATPPGRGGIGIVRLSGPDAAAVALSLLSKRRPLEPGRARFTQVIDPTTEAVLDEAVVTHFAAPHSYTGEHVVEIAVHGAPVLLEHLVRLCVQGGARLALPGEFTQRAFLSGRLDLTQAEAVHDLISATTLHQARVAASQMGGALAKVVVPLKTRLVHLIATLEAGIDFAEDDLDVLPSEEIAAIIGVLLDPVSRLEQSYRYGRLLHEGVTLVIVGQPNAGKSSLFNALLENDRAIVTALPGTTRDLITEQISFGGVPVEITDTAGLRVAADEIEALGIARTRETLADAALILLVLDATKPLGQTDRTLLQEIADRPTLVSLNKADVTDRLRLNALTDEVRSINGAVQVVETSAITGLGLLDLRAALQACLQSETVSLDSAVITNQRQHAAILAADRGLAAAHAAVLSHVPHEMVLLDLHAALHALDLLTGNTSNEDILNLIFSTFCIGK